MATVTVLIADADRDTRIVYGTFLRHHGVRVLEAATPSEASRLFAAERPDAVFYDPLFEELETALEAGPPFPRALVALSASILPPEIVARLTERRVPILQKPCSPTRMLQVLQVLLSPVQPAPSSARMPGATSRSEEASPSQE